MRKNDLHARPKRRFRATTKASASLPVAENVVSRELRGGHSEHRMGE